MKWQPSQVGNVPDDWVKVFTVAIPNLPLIPNRKVKRFLQWIQNMDGFIGFRPEYPHGTLILFKTENDAKRAKNIIPTYEGGYNSPIGRNIGEIFIPPEYIKEG